MSTPTAMSRLKKAVPKRARIMLSITVAIMVVVALGIANMMGSDPADEIRERGSVAINLNPSEQNISRSLPGEESIIPADSEISRTVQAESERAMNEALARQDVSLTQPIRIPGVGGETTETNSPDQAPTMDTNVVRDMLAQRRETDRQQRDPVRGATVSSGRTTITFSPSEFLANELERIGEDRNSVASGVGQLVGREIAVRGQGSAQLRKVATNSNGQVVRETTSRPSLASTTLDAASYLGNSTLTSQGRSASTVAERLEMFRQSSGVDQSRTGAALDIASGFSENTSGPVPSTANQRMIPAGTILYAVLDTGINSDNATVVRATIVQEGPFKGAHVLGQVDLAGEKVILQFNQMGHRGQDYSLSAVAVDPNTSQAALADNVDRHLLQRYGMLWGSAFIEGFADALSNTTTVINSDGSQVTNRAALPDSSDQALVALGRVGERTTPIMARQFTRKPTVHVAPGRAIGLMLLQGLPY